MLLSDKIKHFGRQADLELPAVARRVLETADTGERVRGGGLRNRVRQQGLCYLDFLRSGPQFKSVYLVQVHSRVPAGAPQGANKEIQHATDQCQEVGKTSNTCEQQ